MIRAAALAVALLPLAGAAAAETLHTPPLPGWRLGHAQDLPRISIREYAPPGQSVERWRELVTVERLTDMGRTPPPAFIAEFTRRYVATCPRRTVSAVPMGRDAGVRIDCASTDETVFARALPGARDMHVVQIAMKGLVLPDRAQWARGFLGGVTVAP